LAEKCVVPRLLLGLLNIELRKFRRHIEHARTSRFMLGIAGLREGTKRNLGSLYLVCLDVGS
jgi:hypothetical protein